MLFPLHILLKFDKICIQLYSYVENTMPKICSYQIYERRSVLFFLLTFFPKKRKLENFKDV